MATRHEITKRYAREYERSSKKDKGRVLDELVAVTGWSRANARRSIIAAAKRKGPARSVQRKPRARTYGYDTLKVLIEVWTLIGEPCGKYLAPIMAPTLAQLEVFGELGKVADRLNAAVRAQLVTMSPATIDRMLKPTKAARYPAAKSATRPGPRCVPRSWSVRRWTRWNRPRASSRSIWSLTADTASRVSTPGR